MTDNLTCMLCAHPLRLADAVPDGGGSGGWRHNGCEKEAGKKKRRRLKSRECEECGRDDWTLTRSIKGYEYLEHAAPDDVGALFDIYETDINVTDADDYLTAQCRHCSTEYTVDHDDWNWC